MGTRYPERSRRPGEIRHADDGPEICQEAGAQKPQAKSAENPELATFAKVAEALGFRPAIVAAGDKNEKASAA